MPVVVIGSLSTASETMRPVVGSSGVRPGVQVRFLLIGFHVVVRQGSASLGMSGFGAVEQGNSRYLTN